MPSLTFNHDWFRLRSKWTNKNGSMFSSPTKVSETITIKVSGLPEGAVISSSSLKASYNSPLGGAAILTVNGTSVQYNGTRTVSTSVTGNGSYSFKFVYKSNGVDNMSDGTHYGELNVTGITLTVNYTGAEPSDDPEEEPVLDNYVYPDSHNICVYGPNDDDFTNNGLGILDPISCIVTEEAGGQYELEMKLPAEGDIWQLIECESVIKAPVPLQTIDPFQQAGVSYWKVKSTQSGVPVKSKIPTITRIADTSGYSAWSASTHYYRGDKVAYNGKVWQYNGATIINSSPVTGNWTKAPGTVGYWVDCTSYNTKENSGKTLATLARNEMFTKIGNEKNGWLRVKTSGGVTGYVQKKYVEQYSQSAVVVEGREIRQQCFRVYRIEKDSSTMTVTINARHISYDFAKTYLSRCDAKSVSVPTAITVIQDAALFDDNRQIYTDIDDAKVDLDCSWDNGVTALLNPDAGVVAQLQARLVRDNEDFFILRDNHVDRGFRIEYGNNLKALQWTVDTSSMVTRVIPHAKDANDNDLLLDDQWVDSELIDEYPVVYVEALAVNCKIGAKGKTVDGTEVEHLTAAQCDAIMEDEAQKRFTVDHADEPEVTIDVDLVMLGSTVEYSHIAPLEILFMYDTVHIKHPVLNLDITAYMTGYEYDAILQRYTKITLTNARRRIDNSVSGFDLRNNSIRFEKLSSTAVERLKG